MFGLRQKLLVGFGGLLLILLLVSGISIAVMRQHRNALDQFLRENQRSVGYSQNMVDALGQLDDIAMSLSPAEQTPRAAGEGNNAAVIASSRPLATFEENLDAENRNLTLPGEDQLAGELT